MTTLVHDHRIHIAAPSASAAFALERRLAHLHASAVCVHGEWSIELHDQADTIAEIEGAVRDWLHAGHAEHAVVEIDGRREAIEPTR